MGADLPQRCEGVAQLRRRNVFFALPFAEKHNRPLRHASTQLTHARRYRIAGFHAAHYPAHAA
jgi:hypothetical protein